MKIQNSTMGLKAVQKLVVLLFGVSQMVLSCDTSAISKGISGSNTPESLAVFEKQPEFDGNMPIDSLQKLAIELYMQGNYQRAMDYIGTAYQRSKKDKDRKQLAKIINTLGLVHWRLGNNKDAMQCYVEAGHIAEAEQENRLLGLTYTNRSLILKEEKEYEEALKVNEEAIKIFQENSLFRDLGIAFNNQGQIYKNKDEMEVAKQFYQKALDSYEKVNYKDGVAATYHNLAQIATWQGDEEEALLKGEASLAIGLEIGSKVRVSEAYLRIAETYEYFEKPTLALKFYKKHFQNQQDILKSNQSKNLAQYQAQLGAEVQNLKIDNLEKEKKIAQNHFWLILISSFMLILITGFLVNRYFTKMRFRRKELERELENYNHVLEVKEQELKSHILDLSMKAGLIAKLQNQLSLSVSIQNKDEAVTKLLETKILTEEDWETFKTKFRSIHPGFFTKMREARHQLTEAEIRYMLLLRLKLTSKEMADILGISPQSVRVCKMRLKKKLNKEGIENVEAFLNYLINYEDFYFSEN